MKNVAKWLGVALLAVLADPASVRGQELLRVTGQSRVGAATWVDFDGTQRELEVRSSVSPGTLNVAAQAQIMLFGASGVALVVIGPASLGLNADEIRNETRLELRQGKVMLVSAPGGGRGSTLVLTVPASGARDAVTLRIGPSRTYLAEGDAQVAVAYVADGAPATLSVTVGESPVTLPSNHVLTVAGGVEPRVGPLGEWLERQGFQAAWGRNLGVESARAARKAVERNLFTNIIEWDRYAGAANVVPRLAAWRFNPEIRQTVQSVTTVNQQAGRGAAPKTTPFAGANEIPIISPAAASVQNLRTVAAGVTAVQLNRDAATLLGLTGSRGLGFGGLARLAVPGSVGGIRTVGPAGLGATRP
jgi:hypothetical protein